jgi:hypothetical protein
MGIIMELVIKMPCHVHGVPRNAGDMVVLSTAEARQFISSGHAEEIKMDQSLYQRRQLRKSPSDELRI